MNFYEFSKLVRFKRTISVIYAVLFPALIARIIVLDELLLLSLANLFAVWVIFSFNDLEDAKYDKKFKLKRDRNLIATGKLSKNEVMRLIMILVASSLLISLYINILNFYLIVLILLTGFLYSSSYIRLKARPPFDVISHALIGPLISMSIIIKTEMSFLLSLVVFIFLLGSTVPELLNQNKDFYIDKKTNTKTTAHILGKKSTLKISYILVIIMIIIYGIIFFLYGGISLLILYIILSPFLLMFVHKRMKKIIKAKPLILLLPLFIIMIVTLLGFFHIL